MADIQRQRQDQASVGEGVIKGLPPALQEELTMMRAAIQRLQQQAKATGYADAGETIKPPDMIPTRVEKTEVTVLDLSRHYNDTRDTVEKKIAQMRVKAVHNDYLACRFLSGLPGETEVEFGEEGQDILVAKPYGLRESVNNRDVLPISPGPLTGYTYSYLTAGDGARTAHIPPAGEESHTEWLVPNYIVGDVIHAAYLPMGDIVVHDDWSGTTIGLPLMMWWVDLNLDGRCWQRAIEAGGAVILARVTSGSGSTHYCELYGDGYGQPLTAANIAVATTHVLTGKSFPAGKKLTVFLIGEAYHSIPEGVWL